MSSIGKVPPKVDEATIHLDASNAVTVAAGGVGATQLASGAVTFAKLNASALPKQAGVAGSDFTTTSVSYVDVTGVTITTNGAGLIIVAFQMVSAGGVTAGGIQLVSDVGNVQGTWFVEVEATNIGAAPIQGELFKTIAQTSPSPNVTTNVGTFDGLFVGWSDRAATIKLQAISDGTRTFTVKIGSMIASSI